MLGLLKQGKLYLLATALFLAVFLLSGCNKPKENIDANSQGDEQVEAERATSEESEPKKEEVESETKKADGDQKLSEYTEKNNQIKLELISKYNAVDIARLDSSFSLELTKNIKQNNVFFSGDIKDVYARKNQYYISIKSSSLAALFDEPLEYVAELECSKEFADYIIKNKIFVSSSNNLFDETYQLKKDFFAVAKIDSIAKPSYNVSASPTSNEEAEIDFDSGEYFLLKGKLIDYRFGAVRTP